MQYINDIVNKSIGKRFPRTAEILTKPITKDVLYGLTVIPPAIAILVGLYVLNYSITAHKYVSVSLGTQSHTSAEPGTELPYSQRESLSGGYIGSTFSLMDIRHTNNDVFEYEVNLISNFTYNALCRFPVKEIDAIVAGGCDEYLSPETREKLDEFGIIYAAKIQELNSEREEKNKDQWLQLAFETRSMLGKIERDISAYKRNLRESM